jgi:Raf kinase inhibitor-like YbhB/YbcL family protein
VDAFAFCKSTLTIALLAASMSAWPQQPDPLTQFEVKGHAGTKSFLLMVEDPDATSPLPFVHWIAIGSPDATGLAEGVAPVHWPLHPRVVEQGSNSRSTAGYFGPRPPPGDAPHRYHFQIFALDVALRLPTGANRHAVLKAAKGHVLAQGSVVGTFRKAP